ncbi:hypothetical protein Q5530_20100 [Saccharothrix sp. BKS2]|uniref:hypothetical protein n=1 Tax=Saccharothrix sp. BKS2 TaxID=3064400 RepID=UPI0039E8518D
MHSSIVSVDIADSSAETRRTPHKVRMVEGLHDFLRESFAAADIAPDRCDFLDRGDGWQILVNASVPKIRLADRFVHELKNRLLRYNSVANEEATLRLRIALHYGEVTTFGVSHVSKAVEHATRIRDAPFVKHKLKESGFVLALVASDDFYGNVIHEDAVASQQDFEPFSDVVRDGTIGAWLCLFGSGTPRPSTPRRAAPGGAVEPAPLDIPPDEDDRAFNLVRAVVVHGAPDATTRQDRTTAPVLHGPPGSGRTRFARLVCGELEAKGQPNALLTEETGHRSRPVPDLLLEAAVRLVDGGGRWDFAGFLGCCAVLFKVLPGRAGADALIAELASPTAMSAALHELLVKRQLTAWAHVVPVLTSRLTGRNWLGLRPRFDRAVRPAELREVDALSRRDVPEAHAEVDDIVLRSFLTDLDAHANAHAKPKLVDPVVVVDDPVGATALVRTWGRVVTRARPARMTLVAVGDRELVDRLRSTGRAAVLDDGPDGGRPGGGEPSSGGAWTPLPLSGLTESQVRRVAAGAGVPEELREPVAHDVLAVTAGHLEATVELVRAAAVTPEDVRPARLLGTRPPGRSVPLSEYLLDRLLQKKVDKADDAVTCAAARNQAEAAALMNDGILRERTRAFTPAVWPCDGPAGTRTMHPLARLLLLRRLAERPADAPDGWSAVFTRLAGSAERRRDEAGALYHGYASGDVDRVVAELEERLVNGSGRRWLSLVETVATCPCPPGEDHDAASRSPVGALVAAWRATNDPHLVDRWADHHAQTASHLRQVAGQAQDGHMAFLEAAEWHEERARRQPHRPNP